MKGRSRFWTSAWPRRWIRRPVETSGDPSLSPTMTSAGTVAGMILGTAAYMTPEQARGKSVDSRTDIWAFGCVLFELLTGRQMFQGETVTDVLGAILHREPDWDALPAGLPAPIHRLLRRCLERDQRKRRRDIGDARIVIEEAVAGKWEDEPQPAKPTTGMFSSPWAKITAVMALLLIGALLGRLIGGGTGGDGEKSSGPGTTAQVEIVLPDDAPVAIGSFLPAIAFIPDESGIVYVGLRDGVRRLYVRKLDDPVPVEFPGTEGAEGPFVSPDSQWIGFYAEFALWKVPVAGGTPSVITPLRDYRGGAWGPEDQVVFADGQSTFLKQIPAAGGDITALTSLQEDEWSHRFPSFLPDGDHVLYCAQAGPDFHYEKGHLRAYSISDDRYVKLDGTGCDAAFARPDRLLFIQGGDLVAVPFDLAKLAITGPPETLVAGRGDPDQHRRFPVRRIAGGEHRLRPRLISGRRGGGHPVRQDGEPDRHRRAGWGVPCAAAVAGRGRGAALRHRREHHRNLEAGRHHRRAPPDDADGRRVRLDPGRQPGRVRYRSAPGDPDPGPDGGGLFRRPGTDAPTAGPDPVRRGPGRPVRPDGGRRPVDPAAGSRGAGTVPGHRSE